VVIALPVDLDTAAAELFGLSPAEFTAARDRRAAELKPHDAALAAAVKKLRRPTVSAWLVNQLARERATQVRELVDVGAAMREAQQQAAGDRLRSLAARRHEVIATLVADAEAIATAQGQPVTPQTKREIEGTLEAASADPQTAAELRAGRLEAPRTAAGFGVEPATAAAAARRSKRAAKASPETARDRRAAERAIAAARQQADQATALVTRLEARVEELQNTLDSLDRERTAVQQQARSAGSELRQARKAQVDATKRAERAGSRRSGT
jgi:DNA repair exonuclease SbcCD ATPase subunit